MQSAQDHTAIAAFARLLRGLFSARGVVIFISRPDGFRPFGYRPVVATEATAAALGCAGQDPEQAIWRNPAPELVRALTSETAVEIDPALVGLAEGVAVVRPLAGRDGPPHFLLIHDPRPGGLTPHLTNTLDDAAATLAPLLSPRGWQAPRPAQPPRPATEIDAAPTRGAIQPRAAAHRIVEAALRDRAPDSRLVIFMIDLDRFRSINEALGMAAGDALLAVIGARLERALERGDRLVRLEGDRFLVLATNPPSDLLGFARRLLDLIGKPLSLAGHSVAMQASIGIVEASAEARSAAALLPRADSAMRRAKSEGRDRCALHDALLDAANLEKSQLELDLANAPLSGQMHLSYQPFISLETGAVTGVEALIRWRHPTRGDLQPSSFIPMAESTGLILPIGQWALRTACREATAWPAPLSLAVNISALQFHQPGFTAQVDAALTDSGFPADRLELEITETVLMRDNPETIDQLNALIARGIRIALDDFGTGYSALAYLARLPHHRIKLDRSFVRDLGNPATAELIRAIIAQARANGVCITAEGVERPEQIAQVRAMGFTHAQGFATGTPTANLSGLLGERLVAS